MFRTSNFRLQEDYIIYAVLYGLFSPWIYAGTLEGWNIYSCTYFNPVGSSELTVNFGYKSSYYSECLRHKYLISIFLDNDHLYIYIWGYFSLNFYLVLRCTFLFSHANSCNEMKYTHTQTHTRPQTHIQTHTHTRTNTHIKKHTYTHLRTRLHHW